MALATSSLVDGEWVTRTLDVNTVLRHYDQQDRNAITTVKEVERAPKLGLLTQTVIRSPLVHWILPIRLRDNEKIDVAFVGDDFVQIKELRCDGLLWDVIRKEDFGARIRNARIVGSVKAYEKDPDVLDRSVHFKKEDTGRDVQMSEGDALRVTHPLPPQCLLLQLDTGDSVFLTINYLDNDKFVFISSKHRVSKPMLKLQPGMHLAVDPSSRYMVVGCSEGVFAVYSLHSRDSLKRQYIETSCPKHVESETQIYPGGIILKMEFLYPATDDDHHIILLVLVILKGKTRMLLYEWDAGFDLKSIKARSSRGYLLDKPRQVPLLLIPLTIKSSFILVYEASMAVCQGILHGTPKMTYFNDKVYKPTACHHGSGSPLWTSWTRPSRLESHKVTRDDLFIAREDGLVKFLEIDSEDEDFVTADNNIGELGANCGIALASLDYPNKDARSGDLFVVGGDASPGGTYLLQARKNPVLTEPILNWSPAHDFVTTYNPEPPELVVNGVGSRQEADSFPRPDRIFACVGKGSKGGITELRHGYEANIGLEVDYDSTIMDAWALSPFSGLSSEDGSHIFLLSTGERSGVLQLSGDATEIIELEEDATKLDLNHRTIVAVIYGQYTIQVTEKTIVVTNDIMDRTYQVDELLRIDQGEGLLGYGSTIDNAAIGNGCIVFTTRLNDEDNSMFLQLLDVQLETSDMDVDSEPGARTLCNIEYDVSSITTGQIAGGLFAVIAGWGREGSVILTFQPLAGGLKTEVVVPPASRDGSSRLDTLVSIVFLPSSAGIFLLLCGTRSGKVILLEFSETTFHIVSSQSKRVGATPALVSKDEFTPTGESFFVNCDLKGYILTLEDQDPAAPRHSRSLNINRIWLSDALKPGLYQPKINSIVRMRPPRSEATSGSLLVISGTQLLITGLSAHAQPVTRHIAVGGTPTRLLYSHSLDLLVVATSIDGKSSLLFIDPTTGEDISQPLDEKTKDDVTFASGLGNANERIFRLFEWGFTKDGRTWNFIIAATSTGRLLIISIQERARPVGNASYPSSQSNGTGARQICYYTRHKFKSNDPVYSATGLSDGLLWCAGTKLSYDILDLTEKKFKRMTDYELPSPATDIIYEDGTIYALTSCHSLEILKLASNDSGEFRIIRTHGDQLARDSLHQLLLDRPAQRPIHLVSDKLSSVVGLWPTHNTKADTLEPIFEAALQSSILRFRFGRCRPTWDPTWSERITNPPSNPASNWEVLGLSITGSLSHFAILDFKTWRLLRFLMDLATRSPEVCEFTYRDDPMPMDTMTEPKTMMHIDGDILKTVLHKRGLEGLLGAHLDTDVSRRTFNTFTELIQDVHQGTLEEDGTALYYINQAYADLKYHLRPVI
ncbi:mono-functional DNA-alkylating methyl methanesulfonate N-term-domain-containing protein [Rhexocercosporidium sp. MPI-PUGE-AT-0058]|nr:mono-functional DNA-alkylating methyl methanesulfonate N-term-domain-containing protein [Rhexocercosporidium sp. MPI-PUGE-AT-0058]